MNLVCNPSGAPELADGNLVFESPPWRLQETRVHTCTAEFSAGSFATGDGEKEWIPLNDIGENRDRVIAVSPDWVAACPPVMEVCVRKVGARFERGRFASGRFADVTAELEAMPAEVIYLLPFFKPGFRDLQTGADVRKGSLGSPYAVQDFFLLDPHLVTPPEEAPLASFAEEGLISQADIAEVHLQVPAGGSREITLADLVADSTAAASWGPERLLQLAGRAELRQLTRRAHELGKRVIFDLVLTQTSRDHALVAEHPEWYVRDGNGRPATHRIAWLHYSDVALLDLDFNEPLPEHLLQIAPYWIERCDLDGVRIDASQTVEPSFLMRVANRIHEAREDALVLCETLCPLQEACELPADMIYALMVDFHHDVLGADPLIEHLEQMHRTFASGTVAMAYFENHDSPRASQVWLQSYCDSLAGPRPFRRLAAAVPAR